MNDFLQIMRFGLPYWRRYWLRFMLGVLLGFIFGLSNGLTLGGVYLMLGRLGDTKHVHHAATEATTSTTTTATPAVAATPPESAPARTFHAAVREVQHDAYQAIDPWLPLANRPLDWKQLLGGLLLIPLVTAFRGLMSYTTTYLMNWTGQRISNDIKEDLFRKISSLSLDFFHRHPTAELLSRINEDTGAVNACLRMGLADLIKEPSTILVLFVGLLFINWKLTILALFFIPFCVIPTRIVSRKIKSQGRENNIAYIQQSSMALESFQNVRVTKAYELADEHAKLFRQAGNRASYHVLKTVQARAMLNPIVETFNSFGIGAVLIYAIYANIPIETLGTFLLALILFYTPFKKLSGIQVYLSQAGLAIDRLLVIFRAEPSVAEPVHPVKLGGFSRAIEYRDVSFSYGEGPVLERINLTVKSGERVGLVGESGSGKSSLINLLFRFHDPTGGRIEIDGHPLDSLAIAELRSHMALVSQDILLFNASVAQNIAFGKLGATREEIIAAAKEAHAHDFIEGLPQGYDTPLGERGVRLSGGQRQRIAIARAFIRNAPILVLDEATASLDSQSEAEVQKTIDHLAEHRTVVCVAHRLSTLRGMDKILVLEKGRIVEQGTFDELLSARGIFTAMAARQSIFPQAA